MSNTATVITTKAGEALIAQMQAENKALVIDKFIFANVSNRPAFPNRDDVVPVEHVVHESAVHEQGRLTENSVIYSTTLASNVGPFSFNWSGLFCSEHNVLVAINFPPSVDKTVDAPGITGNTLVRSFVLEYKGISETTNITVDPSSWQYDAHKRMSKMDNDTAQAIIDQNGKDWFIDDGFIVTPQSGAYNIKAGAGYVSGHRISLDFDRIIQVPEKPAFIYVDVFREGSPTGEWQTKYTFVVSVDEKGDYTDGQGVNHFVCKIAQVFEDGSVSMLRKKDKVGHYVDSINNLHTTRDAIEWRPNLKIKTKDALQLFSHTDEHGVKNYYLPNVNELPFVTGDSLDNDVFTKKFKREDIVTKTELIKSKLDAGVINLSLLNGSHDDRLREALIEYNEIKIPEGYSFLEKHIIPTGVTIESIGECYFEYPIQLGVYDKRGELCEPNDVGLYWNFNWLEKLGYTIPTIVADAIAGDNRIELSSVDDFAIGDAIQISNGYCDMWRALEQAPSEMFGYDQVKEGVDLWSTEQAVIKDIIGNSLILESSLINNYHRIVKLYGFFGDENNTHEFSKWNRPIVCKMVGASNIKLDLKLGQGSAGVSGIQNANCNIKVDMEESSAVGVELRTARLTKVYKSNIRSGTYTISIRRGSFSTDIVDCVGYHGGVTGDASMIVWERSYLCSVINPKNYGYNTPHDTASIGVYLNTCHHNSVVNSFAYELKANTAIMFGGNNCSAKLLTSTRCNLSFTAYVAIDFCLDGISHDGMQDASGGEYLSSVLNLGYCYDYSGSNVTQTNAGRNLTGRVHMYKTFNDYLYGINCPGCIIDYSTPENRVDRPDEERSNVGFCTFWSMNLVAETYQIKTRRVFFDNIQLNNGLNLKWQHQATFTNSKIRVNKGAAITMDNAPWNNFVCCDITGDYCFDFKHDADSYVYIDSKTRLDGKVSKFIGYISPKNALVGNINEGHAAAGDLVSILTNYPREEIYKNPEGYDFKGAWESIL